MTTRKVTAAKGASNSGATMAAYLQRRIDALERYPGSWGSPESLEFVAIAFIESRQALVRPIALAANKRETRDAYLRFISAINGEPLNMPLYCMLRRHGRLGDLARLIGDFGRWMAREYPPETP